MNQTSDVCSDRLSTHEILFGKKPSMLEEDEDSEDSDDSGTDAPDNLMMTMKKPWKPSPSPRNKYVYIFVAFCCRLSCH